MALYGASVESSLHCLLFLVDLPADVHASTQELASLQGLSVPFVAKLFGALRTAGIVTSVEGIEGGYRLARPADAITVLDVVTALEGDKPMFQCREIRRQCALFGDSPPAWATRGMCGIHAVMVEAESRMRDVLAAHTLGDLAAGVARKAPRSFGSDVVRWFGRRRASRGNSSLSKGGSR
ncbi:MAG: Rrf2 family transcriptional regulator [Gammaproteobacteria bacterium]